MRRSACFHLKGACDRVGLVADGFELVAFAGEPQHVHVIVGCLEKVKSTAHGPPGTDKLIVEHRPAVIPGKILFRTGHETGQELKFRFFVAAKLPYNDRFRSDFKYLHPSREAAEAEARRLAEKYKKPFYVGELIAVTKYEKDEQPKGS